MLIDFSVENFRSFKERQTFSFLPDTKVKGLEDYYFIKVEDKDPKRKPLNLLKIGMLYGANASGKSNLLKAMGFLWDIFICGSTLKNELLDYEPFLFDELSPSANSVIEINFIQSGTKYNYKVEFCKEYIVREEFYYFEFLTSEKAKNVFVRTTDIDKKIPKIVFSTKVKKSIVETLQLNTLWNKTVANGFIRVSADIPQLNDLYNWYMHYFMESMGPDDSLFDFTTFAIKKGMISKNEVLDILSRADFNISGFEIEDDKAGGSSVVFEHSVNKSSYSLPFSEESLGTRTYYGLTGLLLLLVKKPALLPIDELESSLHPELYEAFIISFLKNVKNSQLLFTTHNREFLQKKDIIRRDALWIADKKEDSSTELYSFADFDSSVIRNTSSIYNAYSVGKLGGVPNNCQDLIM